MSRASEFGSGKKCFKALRTKRKKRKIDRAGRAHYVWNFQIVQKISDIFAVSISNKIEVSLLLSLLNLGKFVRSERSGWFKRFGRSRKSVPSGKSRRCWRSRRSRRPWRLKKLTRLIQSTWLPHSLSNWLTGSICDFYFYQCCKKCCHVWILQSCLLVNGGCRLKT